MAFLFSVFFLVQNELGNSFMTVVKYAVSLHVYFLESQLHAIEKFAQFLVNRVNRVILASFLSNHEPR